MRQTTDEGLPVVRALVLSGASTRVTVGGDLGRRDPVRETIISGTVSGGRWHGMRIHQLSVEDALGSLHSGPEGISLAEAKKARLILA